MKNEDLFKQMLDEIDSSEFKGVKNVNDFLERFDQLDESRDVYVFVNGSFECGCIDEQLHEATGNDGAIEVDAFAQIEMRCAKHVRVYGKATYYNWDEDDNQYRECGFGDYDCIEII